MTSSVPSYVQDESVCIDLSDTGCGIPAAHLHKIFDPFFTTKSVGRGTGLGMSISYGIVQEHGGTMSVDSTLGNGTTFTVALPLGEKPRVQSTLELAIVMGTKKILLVDDDRDFNDTVKEILADEGYDVVTAFDGEMAKRVFRSEQPDLVITGYHHAKRRRARIHDEHHRR